MLRFATTCKRGTIAVNCDQPRTFLLFGVGGCDASQAGRRGFESHRSLLTQILGRTLVRRTHLRQMARSETLNRAEVFRRKGPGRCPTTTTSQSTVPTNKAARPS